MLRLKHAMTATAMTNHAKTEQVKTEHADDRNPETTMEVELPHQTAPPFSVLVLSDPPPGSLQGEMKRTKVGLEQGF